MLEKNVITNLSENKNVGDKNIVGKNLLILKSVQKIISKKLGYLLK